jgi:hypothetical protein
VNGKEFVIASFIQRVRNWAVLTSRLTVGDDFLPDHAVTPNWNLKCLNENMLLKLKKKTTKLHGLSPQANYTDRLSDRRLSAKLVRTLADRGCRVVSATVPPQSFNFGFLDRSRYFSIQEAPQLSSRG